MAAVPRRQESLPALISGQRGLRHAARSARQRPAVIPEVADGVHRVLDAYESSQLAQFHRRFYAHAAGAGPTSSKRSPDRGSGGRCPIA